MDDLRAELLVQQILQPRLDEGETVADGKNGADGGREKELFGVALDDLRADLFLELLVGGPAGHRRDGLPQLGIAEIRLPEKPEQLPLRPRQRGVVAHHHLGGAVENLDILHSGPVQQGVIEGVRLLPGEPPPGEIQVDLSFGPV